MTITVNGKEQEFIEGETIAMLMKRMNFIFPLVVVQMDGTTIPGSRIATTTIPKGSRVDIMHLISGG